MPETPEEVEAQNCIAVSGAVIDKEEVPSDEDGSIVYMVVLRQSKPGHGKQLFALQTRDKALFDTIEEGSRVRAKVHLATGDTWNVPAILDEVDAVAGGEHMELENTGVLVGVREDLERIPLRKGGELYELIVNVDGERICVKARGRIIDELDDTNVGDTLELGVELRTREYNKQLLTGVNITTVDIVS